LLLAGCQPVKQPAARQTGALATTNPSVLIPRDPAETRRVYDLPDTVPPGAPGAPNSHPPADVLAQRAADYAKHLEPWLAKRSGNAAQPAASLARGANSGVDPSGVNFNIPAGGHAAADPTANGIPGDGSLPRANPTPSITPTSQPTPPAVTLTPPRTEIPFNKDSPAVNTTLIAGQPRPLPASDDLAQRFLQQVKDYPQDAAAHLDWQLLQFLQGQSVPQLQSIAPLPGEDREMLSTLLDGLSNFRNTLRADNNMLLSRKIRPLLELSDRLRTQAELTVPTLVLCTDVKGFGVYEPIEPARFEAGREHKVIVYCEVENFASLLDEQKRWETKLTQEVVLYTEQNGLEVWRDKVPARTVIDYSRNRRHDFFIVKMIRLPANLTIGRYLLKVTVVDQQVKRVAENTVPIVMVAQ
jgi:hypothetical protein